MRKIIATIKALLFIISPFPVYCIYAVGFLFLRVLGLNYQPWRNRCVRIWGKLAMVCLSVKVHIKGKPPEPPFFLVSNHLSYIDIPIYYSCLKTTFVSKAEVKSWPLVGLIARSLDIIFIDRTRKRDVHRVNSIISTRINKHQGVILFPEGGTSPGDEIKPFRPSLLQHPATEEIPVHYSAIHYQTSDKDLPARESVAWWGDIGMFDHLLKLASNRSITATIFFGDKTITKDDRKILAKELQKEVSSLFIPLGNK